MQALPCPFQFRLILSDNQQLPGPGTQRWALGDGSTLPGPIHGALPTQGSENHRMLEPEGFTELTQMSPLICPVI